MSELARINADLARATIVVRMEFATDLRSGQCTLVLELVDSERVPADKVLLEARGVSDVAIKGLGGGITQLLCLRVSDIRNRQHDRARFVLEDLEEGALSLKCDSLSATLLPVKR